MADKEFKSIKEQIELLRSRGLRIENDEIAADFLARNNYYRVSGYSLTLRSHDAFYSNTTFQNIMDIYNFDNELRHILLHYLEIIEVTVKSVYSHEFAKLYGATGYLNKEHFTNLKKYNEIMDKTEKQKELRLPHEAYLKHFVLELKQDIPLWAYVDLLTISDISFLYGCSNPEIQIAISNSLGFNIKKGPYLIKSFMHSMTILRNLCAHGSRLYNRLFEQKPNLNKSELSLLLTDNEGIKDNAHLFGYILVMRRLLKKEEFASLKSALVSLTKKYPFVSMRYYGFCDNWQDVL